MLANLPTVPAELIQAIGNELTLNDAGHLRLSCKRFGQLLEPRFLRTFTLHLDNPCLERNIEKLRYLSLPSGRAARHIRELTITSLSPSHDSGPGYKSPCTEYTPGRWANDPGSESKADYTLERREIEQHLYSAVSSLRNLRKIRWTTNSGEDQTARTTFIHAIKDLPHLRSVNLCMGKQCLGLPLDLLSRLHEISIIRETLFDGEDTLVFDRVAKAIGNSPDITSIQLTRGNFNANQSFRDLFDYLPANAESPLRLRHLGLDRFRVSFDRITMPHLSNLTSLCLRRLLEPFPQSCGQMDDEDHHHHHGGLGGFRPPRSRLRGASTSQEIWIAIALMKLRLEEIEVDSAPAAFIAYLETYSGLKKLILDGLHFQDEGISDNAAKRFYGRPLLKHAPSLQSLYIHPTYEGCWCLTPQNLPTFSQCVNLRDLTACVQLSHLTSPPNDEANIITHLFDNIAYNLPHLNALSIVVAAKPDCRGSRSQFLSQSQLLLQPSRNCVRRLSECSGGAVKSNLLSTLQAYRAPQGCRSLPAEVSVPYYRLVPEYIGEHEEYCDGDGEDDEESENGMVNERSMQGKRNKQGGRQKGRGTMRFLAIAKEESEGWGSRSSPGN